MAKYLLLVLSVLLALPLVGQRQKMQQAEAFFQRGDYASAARTLTENRNLVRRNEDAALLLSVCYYRLNRLEEAETLLQSLNPEEDASGRNSYPSAWFYLARLYHSQHRFTEAGTYYKRYLRSLPDSAPERRVTIDLLRMCDNGLRNSYSAEGMIAENLGPQVNSAQDEFGPVPSPTGTGRVYFSIMNPLPGGNEEELQSDIVLTNLNGTEWSAPRPLHAYLSSPRHELLLDISPAGDRLYYFRGHNEREGAFLVDTFQQNSERQFNTLRADAPLAPDRGDVTPFFVSTDLIYFAGDLPGGYGGLDLYRLERNVEGQWSEPINLGAQINSPYDEICPFLSLDGQTLYFSSNSPRFSLGGFDVLRSFYLPSEDRYLQPENLGLPLNSADDDTHFRLAPDTYTAFLASDRKDGYGKRDVYIIYFIEPRTEMQRR
ncbi:MAG: tetratricopeptide repeat protein [Bacteroidota bacterium]